MQQTNQETDLKVITKKDGRKYFCPKCKWQLPTENNIITTSMNVLNQCFNCKARLWDDRGKFLGRIEE